MLRGEGPPSTLARLSHTRAFHTPVLTRPFGIKTPREGALSAPYTDTHKHLLTQSSAITIRYNGLSTHPGTPATSTPHALLQGKYMLIY